MDQKRLSKNVFTIFMVAALLLTSSVMTGTAAPLGNEQLNRSDGLTTGETSQAQTPSNQPNDDPGLLFFDDFNDGDADGWTVSGVGTWYVENNEYVVDMGSFYETPGLSIAGDPAWTNYVMDVDMMGEQGYDKIIHVRYLEPETAHYAVDMRSEFFNDIWVGGNGLEGGSALFPNVNNTWYHVTFFAIDNRLIVLVDGVLLLDWSDASGNYIDHGQIGLRGWNSSIVRYDNVGVHKIVATSGPGVGAPDTDYTYLATSVPVNPLEPIVYTWQATDFPLETHEGGITDTINYNWALPGVKVITTTATTSYGTVTDTYSVTIEDEPITGLTAENDSPTPIGAATEFTASVTAGTNITYTWDFGDSMTGSGDVISHTYEFPGVYTATVTAMNSLGSEIATTDVVIFTQCFLPLVNR